MRTVLVIAMFALAVPAWSGTIAIADEREDDALGGTVEAEPIAPSKEVPLYVPLTEEQEELPTMGASEGEDYVPGIEKPATPPAEKVITDQVPADE